MLCSVFVRTASLYRVAEAVKEACKGSSIEGRETMVILRGEEAENPEEETEAINVYVDFDGRLQLLFSVISLNEKIKAIHVLRDTEDFVVEGYITAADLVYDLIEILLEKFGWDNVKWLLL